MGKPTNCIGENKGQISAFVFTTLIVQFLFYLNLKFQASSFFLYSYSPVYVGPVSDLVGFPISHEIAHFLAHLSRQAHKVSL